MDQTLHHVILVDETDQPVGTCEKLDAHAKGLRHRAFSIVLIHVLDGEVSTLIQKRHPDKYHTGGLWSNSCCSHPLPGESLSQAAHRRLYEELGIKTDLIYLDQFEYRVAVGQTVTEHELDHVFIGFYDLPDCDFNSNEVVLTKWVEWETLFESVNAHPEQFTPWLKSVMRLVSRDMMKLIA